MKQLYDEKYSNLQSEGQKGWGGNDRIALLPDQFKYIMDKPFVPQRGNVLELGCGEGTMCRMIAREGYNVSGIDISSAAIEWAIEKQKKYTEKIHYSFADLSIEKIDFHKFHLIIDGNCYHCIEKLKRQDFLKNIYNGLKNNGILFISSMCVKPNEKSRLIFEQDIPYRYLATEEEIINEIEKIGLNIIEFEVFEREENNHIKIFASK